VSALISNFVQSLRTLLISSTQQNPPDSALSNASISTASHPDFLDACFAAFKNNPPSSSLSDFDELG
jgi:hypothetical protein